MRIHIGHHFYGAGNFGDDLMMAGFLHAWRAWGGPGQLSCAIPFDRQSQERRFPEVAWHEYTPETRERLIRKADVWLGLGGPAFENDSGDWMVEHLAREAELCRKYHKPMFFLCVGVSNRDVLLEERIRTVIAQAEHIWTRDAHVADRLKALSDVVQSGADLAHLFLADYRHPETDSHRVGWALHFDDLRQLQLAAVAEAIERLAPRDQEWLIQEVRPLAGSEDVIYHQLPESARACLAKRFPDYAAAPMSNVLAGWPRCESVVTSRFHAALWGAWAGARVTVIERNDKLRYVADVLECRRLPNAHDGVALAASGDMGTIVDRRILENQVTIAWQCCAGFFRTIGAGSFGSGSCPKRSRLAA